MLIRYVVLASLVSPADSHFEVFTSMSYIFKGTIFVFGNLVSGKTSTYRNTVYDIVLTKIYLTKA